MSFKISVIIPTYRRAKTIRRAIESVFKQQERNIEIIVIDGDPEDGTAAIVSEYGDRIKYVPEVAERGISYARNLGIHLATGEYIAFLDSDDEWLEGKLETQMKLFEICSDVSLISTGVVLVDDEGRCRRILNPKMNGHITEQLLITNPIATSSVIVRASLIRQITPLFRGHIPSGGGGEDWDLWIRLSARSEFIIHPEVLTCIHISQNSDSYQNMFNQAFNAYQSLFTILKSDPLLVALLLRKEKHINANIIFMSAIASYELGQVKRARMGMLAAMLKSANSVPLIKAFAVLCMPRRLKIFMKRKHAQLYLRKHHIRYSTE